MESTKHVWGHTVRSWGPGWEPRASRTHFLLVSLKPKSWTKTKRKQQHVVKQSVTESTEDLWTKELQGCGLALYPVLWLAVCLFETASLRWRPQQSKSKSSTCIWKQTNKKQQQQKIKCQAYTTNTVYFIKN